MKPSRFGPELVREMHAAYLARMDCRAADVAEAFGAFPDTMYKLFKRDGLAGRRGQLGGDAPAPAILADEERCPQYRSFVFCAYCPCPPPKCQPGYEWRCTGQVQPGQVRVDCPERGGCACWSAEARRRCNWEVEYQWWWVEKERKTRIVRRMQRGAMRNDG